MDFQSIFRSVLGEKMDFSALLNSFFQYHRQLVKRSSFINADLLAFFSQSRLRSRPDNIVNCQIIAKDTLFALVDVDDGSQRGKIKPKEI